MRSAKIDPESRMLLAMPLFVSDDRYELKRVADRLMNDWELNVTEIQGDNDSAILNIGGQRVALAFVSKSIPKDDIEGTARYAYNWTTVSTDLKNLTGHSIVSILSSTNTAVEGYKLLSKILHSILTTSNAIGVYQGFQSLLIPRKQYIESAESLKKGRTPIDLWVYIGLQETAEGNSGYSYGLDGFAKHEIEIIDSNLSIRELYDLISDICTYVISGNVTFKNGDTLGYTAEQKIKTTLSSGRFVDGQTWKLET